MTLSDRANRIAARLAGQELSEFQTRLKQLTSKAAVGDYLAAIEKSTESKPERTDPPPPYSGETGTCPRCGAQQHISDNGDECHPYLCRRCYHEPDGPLVPLKVAGKPVATFDTLPLPQIPERLNMDLSPQ